VHGGARMKTTSTVLVASSALALVLACGGQSAQTATAVAQNPASGNESTPGVTSAQNGVDLKTIERIADQRCAHEQRCNEIGPGQKYASRDACKEQLVSSTSIDLRATSCPRGFDQDALNRCMTAFDDQPCTLSSDSLATIADCRTDALCMK
jgi:hypothetical protein